ncbi:LysE family transporter [Streptomyces sp. NPDC057950]|uniref:LysE family transporter n=1 Tax=Streptomyces sp. NPDC057950 TaxID=3346288 RepID=UPI0036EE16D5
MRRSTAHERPARSPSGGHRAAAPACGDVRSSRPSPVRSAGHAVYVLVAVTGLAVIVASSAAALTALTVAGAGYLLWLGWGFRESRPCRQPPEKVLTLPGCGSCSRAPGPAA